MNIYLLSFVPMFFEDGGGGCCCRRQTVICTNYNFMVISIFNNGRECKLYGSCDLCVLLQKYTIFIVFSVIHNIFKTCLH